MTTFATLFSGGELAGVGFRAAGMEHLWGVEFDSEIAGVARSNGFNVLVDDVRAVDYTTLPRPDWLHASPPCPNFSVAKTGGEETEEDIEMARACARAIEALQPFHISLENVWKYRESASFAIILQALRDNGYYADYWHLNSASYGVPQTRKRLILIARKDRYPHKPRPTHHDPSKVDDAQLSLFAPATLPWVGWYAAIEDLIDTLPESEFAPWQLARLPVELKTMLIAQGGFDGQIVTVPHDAPSFALTANGNQTAPRAYLAAVQGEASDGYAAEEPAPVITTAHGAGKYRALLVPGGNANSLSTRNGDEPSRTIGDCERVGNIPRACLQQGRTVRMTPRALARFQSVPDSYRLPDSTALACKVIGNGLPCLLVQRVAESQLEAICHVNTR